MYGRMVVGLFVFVHFSLATGEVPTEYIQEPELPKSAARTLRLGHS